MGLVCSVIMISTSLCDVERSDKKKPGLSGVKCKPQKYLGRVPSPVHFGHISALVVFAVLFECLCNMGRCLRSQFESPAFKQSMLDPDHMWQIFDELVLYNLA